MNIQDLLCDLYDIKHQSIMHGFGKLPKDNDGTEFTITDCIDNIIYQLEGQEKIDLHWDELQQEWRGE